MLLCLLVNLLYHFYWQELNVFIRDPFKMTTQRRVNWIYIVYLPHLSSFVIWHLKYIFGSAFQDLSFSCLSVNENETQTGGFRKREGK